MVYKVGTWALLDKIQLNCTQLMPLDSKLNKTYMSRNHVYPLFFTFTHWNFCISCN